MAETTKTNLRIPHGNEKYPWDLWLDGNQHRVTKGIEFEMSISRFQSLLHSKASQMGNLKVKTGSRGDTLFFQFIEKESPQDGGAEDTADG